MDDKMFEIYKGFSKPSSLLLDSNHEAGVT